MDTSSYVAHQPLDDSTMDHIDTYRQPSIREAARIAAEATHQLGSNWSEGMVADIIYDVMYLAIEGLDWHIAEDDERDVVYVNWYDRDGDEYTMIYAEPTP